jgi:methylmalonyl-CoA mutase N-terminal domain/subunit
VNAFPEGNAGFSLMPSRGHPGGTAAQRITPEEEAAQVRRVGQWRAHRDARRVASALDELSRATEKGENVMPHVLTALRAKATLGEIVRAFQDVYGSYRERSTY